MCSQIHQILHGGGRSGLACGNSGLGLLSQRQFSSQRSCTHCQEDELGCHHCLCALLALSGYAPILELCDCEACILRDDQLALLTGGDGYGFASLLGVGQQGLLSNGLLGGRARGGMNGTGNLSGLGGMNGLSSLGAIGGIGALGGRGIAGGLGGGRGSMFGSGLGRGGLSGSRNGAPGGFGGLPGSSGLSGIGNYGGFGGFGGGGYGRGGRGRFGGSGFNELLRGR